MELTRDLQMFCLKTLVISFTLLGGHCSHGQLDIRRMDSPVKLHLGDNTTLPCLFYGYYWASPLDLTMVSVKWTLRTSEGEEKLVYWFHAGNHIQNRSGSHIPHSGLMEGDGSLYIPNLQASDEGEYTCTVIVTPQKAISKVTMEVSAKPNCTISDSRLEMTPDTKRSVTCHVSGFHPKLVEIHWVKYSKSTSNKSQLDNQTWIRVPVQNRDGTFNVISLLTVRPMSTDEDGDVYSCVIHHRSLEDALSLNFTLSVRPIKGAPWSSDLKLSGQGSGEKIETPVSIYVSYGSKPVPDICTSYINGIITVILLAMAINIIAGGFFIYKYVPIQVSQITGDAGNRSLVCQISGFRPRKLDINLFCEESAEKQTRHGEYSWSLRTTQENDIEQMRHLQPNNDGTGLYLEPVITSDKWFYFSCVCVIHISPQFQMQNEDKIILKVVHVSLKLPISRYQQQYVKRNFSQLDVCNGNRRGQQKGHVLFHI